MGLQQQALPYCSYPGPPPRDNSASNQIGPPGPPSPPYLGIGCGKGYLINCGGGGEGGEHNDDLKPHGDLRTHTNTERHPSEVITDCFVSATTTMTGLFRPASVVADPTSDYQGDGGADLPGSELSLPPPARRVSSFGGRYTHYSMAGLYPTKIGVNVSDPYCVSEDQGCATSAPRRRGRSWKASATLDTLLDPGNMRSQVNQASKNGSSVYESASLAKDQSGWGDKKPLPVR
ncbi:hypothetical protein DL764_000198 [Monosporascus ibericus]|uniref:Uncharacterized protein n=1 Tax=Monosporascus ibericus TaxID=155417 RepID=A0A4Q4TWD2_9PEZI|nr:hypothetical protein DL764_000198 [Monosporascus ibericus]